MTARRIGLQDLLDERGEPVTALLHVGDTAASRMRSLQPGSPRQRPDRPCQSIMIVAAADPHPVTAGQIDLGTVFDGDLGEPARRPLIDLDRQEASVSSNRALPAKPSVTKQGKHETGMHIVAPRDLAR